MISEYTLTTHSICVLPDGRKEYRQTTRIVLRECEGDEESIRSILREKAGAPPMGFHTVSETILVDTTTGDASLERMDVKVVEKE